jgi:hypothetical protein
VALKANHEVKVFLINSGVELENIKTEKYDINEQVFLYKKQRPDTGLWDLFKVKAKGRQQYLSDFNDEGFVEIG